MPQNDPGAREQLFLVNLIVDGVDLGIWDQWDGADKDTDTSRYRSGGQQQDESMGGGTTISNLTITRNYRYLRDRNVLPFLLERVGMDVPCQATKIFLDRGYRMTGATVQAIGTMKTFTDPKPNSNSNNPATIAVVIEPSSLTAT